MAGQSASSRTIRASCSGQPIEQRRLRDQHRRAGIGQHEGEPLGRVVRIERQIGAAGLEDAEQPDQHLERALDAQPDHHLGADAERAQMMRQLVGARVELAVAERWHPRTPPRSRRACVATCAANSSGSVAAGTARAVSFQSRRMVWRSSGPRMSRLPIGAVGRRDRRLQQPDQPRRQRLARSRGRTGRADSRAAAAAARPATASEAQRIMRGVVPADAAEPQAAGIRRQARRGRPDSSRTPPGCRTARPVRARPWISASPRCWCAISRDWLSCTCREQREQRLARRQLDAQRQRVDEQPHHALDAGNLRRPPRHRDAEHHVVAPGQPAQQDRPGRLDHGVERQALARAPAGSAPRSASRSAPA